MKADETEPLEHIVTAWASAWQHRMPAQLVALWDTADVKSWFLSAGSVEPYIGHAVVGYLQRRCLGSNAIGYRPGQLHIRRLAPDIGLAFFNLDWSERLAAQNLDGNKTLGGRVRVTMMMRLQASVWRVFHYAEAPLAPLLELQAFYEAIAADGLENIPSRTFVPATQP